VEGWDGPYVDKAIGPDPWGHPYVYDLKNGGAEITSGGGKEGPGLLHPALIQWAIFLAAAIGFFGYPFLPLLLRKLTRYAA